MNKDLLTGYYQQQHYLKLGIYFIGSIISLLAFLPIGEVRFVFLVFLLFLIPLFIEFYVYHKINMEFINDICETGILEIGKMEIFYLKKEEAGIEFIGRIDSKIKAFKWYSLQRNQKKIIERISKYKKIEITYFKTSRAIKEFHTIKE